jgi:RNA polymerase sigma-70 factor (ECF subfamily)
MYEEMSAGTGPQFTAAVESRANSQEAGSAKGRLKRDSFDRDYIQRLREGNVETERHFANYFGELLSIKLRARLRDWQLIEDLRQETFVRVLTALKSNNRLNSPESLGAFVNSVCNNLLFELYRRDAKRRTIEMDDRFDPPDDRASAESQMATEERSAEIREVLQELSAKDRELLRLVFYEDIDSAQICRSFGVHREYLRVLIHRAKCRFRQCLLRRCADAGRPSEA